MLNMAPQGFEPGPITRSFMLCPGNWEYYFADLLAPILYDLGMSPNGVTLLNCFIFRVTALYMLMYLKWFHVFIVVHIISGIIDCTDGQIARRYSCGSAFGAKLDHVTDNIYATCVCLGTMRNVAINYGTGSRQFVIALVMSITMALLGNNAMMVKERGIQWKDLNILQTSGVIQEWYMLYISIIIFELLIATKTIQ